MIYQTIVMLCILLLTAFILRVSAVEQSSVTNVRQIPTADGNLHIFTLPIGQGDANVIQCPDGTLTVWDMGSSNDDSERFWVGSEIRSFFSGNFDRILNVVVTHQDWDHYRLLLDALPFESELSGLQNIYISCTSSDMATVMSDWVILIDGLFKLRTFNSGNKCGPEGGSCGNIDICPNDPEVELQVLAANLGQHCSSGNGNMDSIVGKITYGDISILLPGDFEDETSDWGEDGPQKLMADFYGLELMVTLNHVSHHGASFLANKPVWRDAVAPKMTWSSGDAWYSYGHPRCAVFDGYINFVGSLCKPGDTWTSPDYCGDNIFDGLPISQLVQSRYTCGTSSTEFELRTDNDYAIYTTTPDASTMNFIDISTDGIRYGIRIETHS